MHSPTNHDGRIEDPMNMRGNNNYNGGPKVMNEQLASKKRTYDNMMAVSPQYDMNNGQN